MARNNFVDMAYRLHPREVQRNHFHGSFGIKKPTARLYF
jgi:hypothetical protein